MFVADRRIAVALALVGAMAVAGCSGSSDKPQTLPPISTTPAAETSSPPSDKTALAQAKTVVRDYYDAINQLSQSMNWRALAALSTDGCTCRKFVRTVRETATRGNEFFGRISVTSLTASFTDQQTIEVLAQYDSTAGGTRTRSGRVLYQGSPHRGAVDNFVLVRTNDRWQIAAISVIRQGQAK